MSLDEEYVRRVIEPDVLFDSGELNIWNGSYPVEFDGRIYKPLAGLEGGISIIQSLDLDDVGGDIQLSGVRPEILAIALSEDFQNREARVYLAARNTQGGVGVAQLEFSGFIDDIRIQEGPNTPSLEIILRGAFEDLDQASDIRYSAADQDEIDPHDTFFDFLQSAKEKQPPFGVS
ncbi:MAG: hypothetical protein ACR2P3_09230 [Geminicoccaceae bacterium]